MHSKSLGKILVVEDDPDVRELLKIRLEVAGYQVFCARDGHRALDLIAAMIADVVILDIGLPLLSGIEVLKSLRTQKRYDKTPVMMLTARHSQADVQKSLLNGAQDYLTKPFDHMVLLARIARLLEGKTRKPAQTEVMFL